MVASAPRRAPAQLSAKLRGIVLARFKAIVWQAHRGWPRRAKDDEVQRLYFALLDELAAKPQELASMEAQIRGLVAPGSLIEPVLAADLGKKLEQIQQERGARG